VLRVTVSIGALLADPGYGAWLEDWLRAADTCLRRAKGSGRNTVVVDRIVVTG
jgi:PleD family two-component response regulator